MNKAIHPDYLHKAEEITQIIENFQTSGTMFVNGRRNKIKLFPLGDAVVNVKAFRIPNLLNKFVYRFFRKSKARRSYEFANILIQKGFGTPQPIAYFENFGFFSLKDSYYMSEQLEADLTFRQLIEIPDYPDHENILKQFAHFSYRLHEAGVEFIDNTPGNTLIKKTAEGQYAFYLVDLNRMKFHGSMNFTQRVSNLAKLTPEMRLVEVISNEYAKLYGKTQEEMLQAMVKYTQYFKNRYYRKKAIKRKLGLTKK